LYKGIVCGGLCIPIKSTSALFSKIRM